MMRTRTSGDTDALTQRLRRLLRGRRGVEERRMFGGVAFLADGHMVCGAQGDALVLRLGRDGAQASLRRRHTRPMDFTGRPLASMIYVDPAGHRSDAALRAWIDRALAYVRTLPPK